MTNIYGRFREA